MGDCCSVSNSHGHAVFHSTKDPQSSCTCGSYTPNAANQEPISIVRIAHMQCMRCAFYELGPEAASQPPRSVHDSGSMTRSSTSCFSTVTRNNHSQADTLNTPMVNHTDLQSNVHISVKSLNTNFCQLGRSWQMVLSNA